MGQCVGYGIYRGICLNFTTNDGSLVFCKRCSELKTEELKMKKKMKKEAQERTEKIIMERER